MITVKYGFIYYMARMMITMKTLKDYASRWNIKFDLNKPYPSDEQIKKNVKSLSDPTYIYEIIK